MGERMADLAIVNIGQLVSGRLDTPLLDADAIRVRNGVIDAVGSRENLEDGVDRVIDAQGTTVLPGLIDSHVHPVLGDFTPRQLMIGFIDSCLHGGVTSMISAGEAHVPGRPKDPVGTKALAILASKAFANARPAGVKVLGGALLLEPGLTEADFAEVAAAGVRLVGEIGISGVNDPDEAAEMTRWAHEQGMKVLVHMGGASIPGSEVIDGSFVLHVRPDVAAHTNGGPTAPALEDVARVVTESEIGVEVVQCGNVRAVRDIVELLVTNDALHRGLVGTDAPSGTGVIPLGILRTVSWVASLGGLPPEQAIAMATGNTAEIFDLPRGVIEPGREADLVIADAPRGSVANTALEALATGDTPSVCTVLIDGEVMVSGSRNTPPPKRAVDVPWMARGGH
jgi:enamidase